jgi:hypothetical protein
MQVKDTLRSDTMVLVSKMRNVNNAFLGLNDAKCEAENTKMTPWTMT